VNDKQRIELTSLRYLGIYFLPCLLTSFFFIRYIASAFENSLNVVEISAALSSGFQFFIDEGTAELLAFCSEKAF
jgi:hypothetical protein